MSDAAIEAEILRQLGQRRPDASICPSEVARALAEDWRPWMTPVREVADAMRSRGRVRITRGGADVAPTSLHRGAVRIARGPNFEP